MGADGQCAASLEILASGKEGGDDRVEGRGHWWKPIALYGHVDALAFGPVLGLNGGGSMSAKLEEGSLLPPEGKTSMSSGDVVSPVKACKSNDLQTLTGESKPSTPTTRGGGPLDNPGQFWLLLGAIPFGAFYLLKQPRSFKSLARSWPTVLGSAAFFDTSLPSAGELDKEAQGNPRARKDRHTSRGPQPVKTAKRSHPKGPKWQRLNGNNGSWTNTDDVAHNGVDGAMLPCHEEESCLEDARGGHFHRRKRAGGKPLSPAARAFLERSQKKGDKKRPSPYSKCASSIELCPMAADHYHFFRDEEEKHNGPPDGAQPVIVPEQNEINVQVRIEENQHQVPAVPPARAEVVEPVVVQPRLNDYGRFAPEVALPPQGEVIIEEQKDEPRPALNEAKHGPENEVLPPQPAAPAAIDPPRLEEKVGPVEGAAVAEPAAIGVHHHEVPAGLVEEEAAMEEGFREVRRMDRRVDAVTRKVALYYVVSVATRLGYKDKFKRWALAKLPGVKKTEVTRVNIATPSVVSGSVSLACNKTATLTFVPFWRQEKDCKPFTSFKNKEEEAILGGLGFNSFAEADIFTGLFDSLMAWGNNEIGRLQARSCVRLAPDGRLEVMKSFSAAIKAVLPTIPGIARYAQQDIRTLDNTVSFYLQQRIIRDVGHAMREPGYVGLAFGKSALH